MSFLVNNKWHPSRVILFPCLFIRLDCFIFGRYRQAYSKICMKFSSKMIMEEKSKAAGNTLLNFKTIYKAIVIKIMWHF